MADKQNPLSPPKERKEREGPATNSLSIVSVILAGLKAALKIRNKEEGKEKEKKEQKKEEEEENEEDVPAVVRQEGTRELGFFSTFYRDIPHDEFLENFKGEDYGHARTIDIPTGVGKEWFSLQPKSIEMIDYSSRVFSDLRHSFGVDDHSFLQSWNLDPSQCDLSLGAGKSGSLFLLSRDKRFILKTLPEREVESLRRVLHRYHKYIRTTPSTLLMKFFGLYRFNFTFRSIYVVLGNNALFSPGRAVEQIWDVKGRKVKIGQHPREGKISVRKEKDLNRTFGLSPHLRGRLLSDIMRDTAFLSSNNLMDYSFLVGTCGDPPKEKPGAVVVHFPNYETTITNLSPLGEKERKIEQKCFLCGGDEDVQLLFESQEGDIEESKEEEVHPEELVVMGLKRRDEDPFSIENYMVPSYDGKEQFLFGIIDFLSPYEARKKNSTFFPKNEI